MTEEHADLIFMHTMASQINDIHESLHQKNIFQSEVTKLVHTLLENQNIIRQELFLIRNGTVSYSPKVPQPGSKNKDTVESKIQNNIETISNTDTVIQKEKESTKEGDNREGKSQNVKEPAKKVNSRIEKGHREKSTDRSSRNRSKSRTDRSNINRERSNRRPYHRTSNSNPSVSHRPNYDRRRQSNYTNRNPYRSPSRNRYPRRYPRPLYQNSDRRSYQDREYPHRNRIDRVVLDDYPHYYLQQPRYLPPRHTLAPETNYYNENSGYYSDRPYMARDISQNRENYQRFSHADRYNVGVSNRFEVLGN